MAIQFREIGDIAQRTKQRPSKSQVDGSSTSVVSTPKPKRGRPKNGFDKLAYNRQFMADKRAATKLGISVKEFRTAQHNSSQAK